MKRILIIPILLLCYNAISQAPGGVKNPVLWQKTWEANSQEDYGSTKFNYYDYQFFDEDRGYNESKLMGLKKTTLFIVFSSEKEAEVGRLNVGSKEIILTDATLIADQTIKYTETEAIPKILTFQKSFNNQNSSAEESSNFIFGSRTIQDNWYEGGIAEVIIYDRLLSKKQIKKVESYLALKYGIPLEQSLSYFQSDGTKIWDPENQGEFTYRLTGIGADQASALNHHQSHNLYCELGLTISSGPIEEMNRNHRNTIEDKAFLLWSDNNDSINFSDKLFKEFDIETIERSWKIQAISDEWIGKELNINIDLNTVPNYDSKKDLWINFKNDPQGLKSFRNESLERMTVLGKGTYTSTFTMDETSLFFTIIQTPKNFSLFNIKEELCDQTGGEIKFKVVGENYNDQNLLLTKSDVQFVSLWNNQEESFTFTNLPFGEYEVALENQPNSTLQTIEFKKEDCDVSQDGKYLLFPNPISKGEEFTLQLPANTSKKVSIEIHNNLGQVVKRQKLESNHGNIYQDKINTEGTYSIVVKDGHVNKVFQLIVIND